MNLFSVNKRLFTFRFRCVFDWNRLMNSCVIDGVLDRGFGPCSVQSKDNTIGICSSSDMQYCEVNPMTG